MPNELRVRQNFVGGLVEDNPLSTAAATLTSAALAAVPVIGTTQHYPIVLDPDGVDGEPEIIYVTAHAASATTATILRGQEGTVARAHRRDMPWLHGPTVYDIEKPMVRLRRSVDQSLALDTWTTVLWDQEDFDSHGMHDVATNTSRLTCVRSGFYLVTSNLTISGNNAFSLRMKRNGAVGAVGANTTVPAVGAGNVGSSIGQGASMGDLLYLVTGDYLEVEAITLSNAAQLSAAFSSFSAVYQGAS